MFDKNIALIILLIFNHHLVLHYNTHIIVTIKLHFYYF